jgi:hypothetical protein
LKLKAIKKSLEIGSALGAARQAAFSTRAPLIDANYALERKKEIKAF